MKAFVRDFSFTALVAALLAIIVSYAGSAVIIFQAAELSGLSPQQTASWIWAVSIGSGLTGLFLSWRMRMPIITAWSTPGAALLVVMLPGVPLAEAVGAYLASALVVILIGLTGSLDAIMRRLPAAVTAGVFAGILLGFGTRVFGSIQDGPFLALTMLACYILCRKAWPRYAVAAALLAGIAVCLATGGLRLAGLNLGLAEPVFTPPAWSVASILGIGLPLALVTLTGQYISGLAVLHASGYQARSNGIMIVTGLFSFLLAPFGAHSICLSSLTAAICTGKDAHPDPSRGYVAGMFCGLFYILAGICGAGVIAFFAALPELFVSILAGLALIGPLTMGLSGIFRDPENLDAGIIAFLATASGMGFLGLGAPFWGLLLGGLAAALLRKRPVRS